MESPVQPLHYPDSMGKAFPLGATIQSDGVNFSIFCKNGTTVDILLFDHVDDLDPARLIPLDPAVNKTYHYWHIFVKDLKPGQLYGYRISGPYQPSLGQYFDPDKILLDPYAKVVAVPAEYCRGEMTRTGKAACPSMGSAAFP